MNVKKEKTAIVTGAASGIGEATARAFASRGVNLVLMDINPELKNLVNELKKTVDVKYEIGDVSIPNYHKKAVQLALDSFGRLDYAFNNAGIGGQNGPISDLEEENWHKVLGVNLHSVAFGMKYQVPAMIKSGGGSIVNNASALGLRASDASSYVYVTSKHAVIGLTKQVAVIHGIDGIRCNAVCPGFIDTPLAQKHDDMTYFANRAALKRLGQPEEIAEVVVGLCEDFTFIHGAVLPIDGGYILQ